MRKTNYLLLIFFTALVWSCKKDKSLENTDIKISEAYVAWIQSDQVDLSFRLSRLGYQETGVSYHQKNKPEQVFEVKAIRNDESLNLSLQNLLPATEYVYQFFFVEKGNKKKDEKVYTVTTLSARAAQFSLDVTAPQIYYDQDGHFNFEIEAENLQDMNLADLSITVNDHPVKMNYPQLVSGRRYKIKLEGSLYAGQYNYANIKGTYKSVLILLKSLPLNFDGERYWISHEKTGMPPMIPTIFGNELYYFYENEVHKWNAAEERLDVVGKKDNVGLMDYTAGTEFDSKIFFPARFSYDFLDPKTYTGAYYFPVVSTYSPEHRLWSEVQFSQNMRWNDSRNPENNRYFIHKNKLYLSYLSILSAAAPPGHSQLRKLYLHEYNAVTKSFQDPIDLKLDIMDQYFFSVNNQMYLMGWVALEDQGFVVGTTLVVYKVSETDFSLEKIFAGGTVNNPMDDLGRQFVQYGDGVLIYTINKNLYFFDLLKLQLSAVNFRNSGTEANIRGFFNYNNNLYGYGFFNTDQQRVYKLSITKGR